MSVDGGIARERDGEGEAAEVERDRSARPYDEGGIR
jgi:hypothetical protein